MLKSITFHPIFQEINDVDKLNRLDFCRILHTKYQRIESNIFMRDGAHFYLNDDVRNIVFVIGPK